MKNSFINFDNLITNDDGSIWFYKLKSFNNENELNNYNEEIEKFKKLKHSNLLQVKDIEKNIINRFCFKSYSMKVYFQSYKNNLFDIMKFKNNYNFPFNINDINKILVDLLKVLHYCQLNNYSFDLIHPKLIFYDKEKNNYILSKNLNENKTEQSMLISNDHYFSNEIIKRKTDYNKFKSSIFSLGLIILECGNDFSISNIYKENFIDLDLLITYFNNFQNKFKYYNKLNKLLSKILKIEENERYDFMEINDNFNISRLLIKENFTKIYSIREKNNKNLDINKREVIERRQNSLIKKPSREKSPFNNKFYKSGIKANSKTRNFNSHIQPFELLGNQNSQNLNYKKHNLNLKMINILQKKYNNLN